MKNFYNEVKEVLRSKSVEEKFTKFKVFKKKFEKDNLSFIDDGNIEVFEEPSYSSFLKIVSQKEVKNRSLGTIKGKIALLHSIVHIEYNAIDLALDALYRFRNLPKKFYKDWIEVADEEIKHFQMVESLLTKFGSFYGALPVHQGLFDAANKALTLKQRMALIPRYMEANGLDANLNIINKLKTLPDTDRIIQVLGIILEEEIDHVRKGDYWFNFACKNESCDYFKIVNSVYPNAFKGKKTINIEARLKAGFGENEIKFLINNMKK